MKCKQAQNICEIACVNNKTLRNENWQHCIWDLWLDQCAMCMQMDKNFWVNISHPFKKAIEILCGYKSQRFMAFQGSYIIVCQLSFVINETIEETAKIAVTIVFHLIGRFHVQIALFVQILINTDWNRLFKQKLKFLGIFFFFLKLALKFIHNTNF